MTRCSRPGKVNVGLLVVLAIAVLVTAGFYLWRWSSARSDLEQARAEMARESLPPPPPNAKPPPGVISP